MTLLSNHVKIRQDQNLKCQNFWSAASLMGSNRSDLVGDEL